MPKTNLFDELVDQYKLEKYLGQNSVTDIYQAFDVDENRTVTLEILLPHLAQNKTYSQRFVKKLRNVAQLKHPHIAQVLQVGETPTRRRPYFAREQVDAYPLRERMQLLAQQSTPVNSVYALKLTRQLAESLALAERLDIYHHDLQPGKILLKPDGTVVIADLGIPLIEETVKNGHTIQLDPRYWSPEQTQNKPMTARSHVYSLGVILFELLTGVLPEAPTTFWQTVKSSPLPSGKTELEKIRTDLSTETYNLVRRALLPPPWARFQNSSELITAIDEAIKAEEYLIQSGTAAPRGALSGLWLKVVAPLALVTVVVMVGLFLLLRDRGGAGSTAVAEATSNSANIGVVEPTDTSMRPTDTPTITSPSPTSTNTAAAALAITPTGPANGDQFGAEDIIQFQWTWPIALATDESFIIQVSDGDQEFVLREVNLPVSGNNYSASVSTTDFPNGSGSYQWQVVLTAGGDPIRQSELRRIDVTTPATNTPTPTEVLTATPEPSSTLEPTPTPLPAVRVIVSSASLREGPGLNYDIITFLEEGDVVTVIGVDETDGNWYNVLTQNGILGWLAISVSGAANDSDLTAVPTAATIPPSPTPTNTPTPTPTFTPSPVPTSSGGGGGGDPQPPPPPATLTPPPPP